MTEVIGATTAPRRFNAVLLGVFAAIALVLATLGIYSVISYSITLRTQEIGIRMALGARRSGILLMVMRKWNDAHVDWRGDRTGWRLCPHAMDVESCCLVSRRRTR